MPNKHTQLTMPQSDPTMGLVAITETDKDALYYFSCSIPAGTSYEVLLATDRIIQVNENQIYRWPEDERDERPAISKEREDHADRIQHRPY